MFQNKTYQSIKDDMLNNCNLDIAKNEGSILNDIFSASALNHAAFYTILEKIFNIAFIVDSYDDNIDKRIKDFGITRKEGKQAVGKVKVFGNIGSVIESGEILIANGNRYEVLDNQNGEIQSEEGIELYIRSIEVGANQNITTSTTFNLEVFKDEIKSIVNIGNIEGGLDVESDEDFIKRFFYIQTHKGTSGNVDDYINWSLEVEGVKNVRVLPLWNGNGSVKVIVMSDDNRNVDTSIVEAVRNYIETKRPIGALVTVVTPTVLEINISAVLELDKGIDLDIIKADLKNSINKYLSESINEVTYTKIAGIISNTYGVIDYKELTINSGTSNIKLRDEQVGSVGSITLSKGSVD